MNFEEREAKINILKYELETEIEGNSKIKELIRLYEDAYKQLGNVSETISTYIPAVLAFFASYIITLKNALTGAEAFLYFAFSLPVSFFIFALSSILLSGAVGWINNRLNMKLEYLMQMGKFFREKNDTLLDCYDSRMLLFYFRHRLLCKLVGLYLICIFLAALCCFPFLRGILLAILLIVLCLSYFIGFFIK